ncbi:MAG: flagellar hook-basal body complex protein FliE [Planctomycetaceae bacterium]|nr:flagellar hook-basal body complex protein FliE [Planctomycetaceae bacterium]
MHVPAVNSTSPVTAPSSIGPGTNRSADATASTRPPFTEVMSQFLGEINGQQLQAEQQVTRLALGESNSINDVVLSVAKADMSFRFLMEIRNRLISSYQEIQRMQV